MLSGKLKSFHKYQSLGQYPGAIDLLSSLTPFPGECSLILFWGTTSPIVCRCGRVARTQASTWSPLVRFASHLLWLGFIYQTTVTEQDHSEGVVLPVFLWHDSPMSLQFCELVHILRTNSSSVDSSGCNCKTLVIQSTKLEYKLHDAGAVVDTARELPSALSPLPADFQFYLVWKYAQQKCSPWHWFTACSDPVTASYSSGQWHEQKSVRDFWEAFTFLTQALPHPSPFLLLDWNVDTIPDSVMMIMKQHAGILNQPDEELSRKVEGNWVPDGLTAHPTVLAVSLVIS